MTLDPELERLERPPQSLWAMLRAQPDRAPEVIALVAAQRFAPGAETWVREEWPRRRPDGLAKITVRRHVRLARVEGAVLGIGGALTAAADLVALQWIESRMVFHVAAAYGFDPHDRMRPAELLFLQDLYGTPQEARAALDGVGKRLAQAVAEHTLRSGDAPVTQRLARAALKRIAERYGGRLVPVVGAPLGALQNARATKDLGRRAREYYAAQARP